MRISIIVNDPWDFGEAINWQHIFGQVLYIRRVDQGERALIELDKPVEYHGSAFRYLVAAPRNEGHPLSGLDDGKVVPAWYIGISDQQAQSDAALVTRWRGGGLAFDGSIYPEVSLFRKYWNKLKSRAGS